MSSRQIKLSNISRLHESEIPKVEHPSVNEILIDLSKESQQKAKLRTIFGMIDRKKDLARADFWSDQFVEQLYAVHVIVTSLSKDFNKNTFVKYFETLRLLFEKLKEREIIGSNTVINYKYMMGQHKNKFGSSTGFDEITDITVDEETDTTKAIVDATMCGGLSQSELQHKIHPRSMDTLAEPRPYIIVNNPRTGPRRRPYLGDASLLSQQLEVVDAQDTDRIDDTDDKRAVVTNDGKPLSTYQIRYRLDCVLGSKTENLKPGDLIGPWRNQYIDAAKQARQTVVSINESYQTAELRGTRSAWMECMHTIIDDSLRQSWPDSEPAHDKIVPDPLAEKIDDKVEYTIETVNIDDVGDQSNYIRSSLIAGADMIGRLVITPLLSAYNVIGKAIDRGHTRSVGGAILLGFLVYVPIQTLGLIMLGVPLPDDPTMIYSYDPRLQFLAVIWLIVVGMNSIPQYINYSSDNRVDLASLGMLSHAVGLAMLQGDISDRLQESIRELR